MSTKVYLVGAGPGSPDLITVRGRRILRQADAVIYDYLVDKRILDEAKEGAELICCDTLGKKRHSDGFSVHVEKINRLVIKKAKEGKRVLRLKNGDPSIFSRWSRELEALVKARIEFEVVPGVTAASAASCYSGIPLTDRRFASSCVFVTGHEDPSKKKSSLDWAHIAGAGTIVLYMAVENLPKIVRQLIDIGKSPDMACAIIQDASLVTQKITTGTLRDIVAKAKQGKVKPPAIIIIGDVAKLEKRFNWLNKNRRILFTGLSKDRFFIKGQYIHLPMIKIAPIESYKEFDAHLKKIANFDWLVFSSRYGVEYFFKRLKKVGGDSRMLHELRIAAIGNSTKNRLKKFGLIADLVPKEESSKGLVEEFAKIDIKGARVFLPRSDLSDKGLQKALEERGAIVASIAAYKNIMPDNLPDLDLNDFDEIMFTSPSGVRNFVKRYKRPPKRVKVSCIGKVTEEEARRYML